jgi:non-ribosomal peptide synthetase component F
MTDPDQIGDSVPIGRPIQHTTVHILDHHGQPTPIGVAGKLYRWARPGPRLRQQPRGHRPGLRTRPARPRRPALPDRRPRPLAPRRDP